MYKAINGWTKDKILEQLDKRMPDEGAATRDGNCCYLTDEGKTCAIGAFIPENLYKKEWDDRKVDVSSIIRESKEVEAVMPFCMNGLIPLQQLHDHWATDLTGTVGGRDYHLDLRKGYKSAKEACLDWVERNIANDIPSEEASQ